MNVIPTLLIISTFLTALLTIANHLKSKGDYQVRMLTVLKEIFL
jgi:hypothetical protein